MSSEEVSSTGESISSLIDEIAELAQSDLRPHEFYLELLGRLTSVIRIDGGRVQAVSTNGLTPICRVGNQKLLNGRPISEQLLSEILKVGASRILLPQSNDESSSTGNSSVTVVCPISSSDSRYALLELVLSEKSQTLTHQEIQRICDVTGELAVSYHRSLELRELRQNKSWWGDLNEFARNTHRTLNRKKVCYTIVNDGRRITGCDRLTIVLGTGRHFRVQAVSGLDRVNRRANVVRKVEKLTNLILPTGEPFQYPTEDQEIPQRIESVLLACLDESNARQIVILPLRSKDRKPHVDGTPIKGEVIGGIIAEQFTGNLPDLNRLTEIAEHSSVSLTSVNEHQRVFLLPVWTTIGRMTQVFSARHLPKTILTLILITAAVLALIFYPADFYLVAEGTLEPAEKRFVFSPDNGVIDSLFVTNGSVVQANAELLKLRSSSVDLQLEEVSGELQTTIKKIAVIETSISDASGEGLTRAQFNQMAAEQKELETWRDSLFEQQKILNERQNELLVNSPISGEVITPNLQQLLNARPVSRGQILMTVANLDGEWTLDLLVPENRIGHLNNAKKMLGDDLKVEFILATDPEKRHFGSIINYDEATSSNDNDAEYGLRVDVAIDENEFLKLRAGARVVGKIQCGQRSIGYVWFHDVYEFVHSRILFRWI